MIDSRAINENNLPNEPLDKDKRMSIMAVFFLCVSKYRKVTAMTVVFCVELTPFLPRKIKYG